MRVRASDLLVIGYAVLSQVELQVWHPDAPPAGRAALLAAVLLLLVRDRAPLLVPLLSAAGGAAIAATDLGDETGGGVVTAAVAAALLGRQGVRAVPALLLLVVLTLAATAANLSQTSDLVTAPLVVVVVAIISAGLFRVSRQVEDLRRRIRELEQHSEDERTARFTSERRRLARDLHDVVSHQLTVAALQASGARVQLQANGPGPDVARALHAAEDAGRQALVELRSLLEVLGQDPSLAPQPGLADAADLVERVRQTGVVVRADGLADAPVALPAGLDTVAYRVLQEALTNAVRHGRGPVAALVAVSSGHLVIDVSNEVGSRRTGTEGHGLVGMRERVGLYGGRLDAGRSGGRWTLRAELPLAAVPA